MPKLSKKDIAYLKGYKASDYDRPSVAVDIVIFTLHKKQLKVLLIKRAESPYESLWALPGGFVNKVSDKNLEAVAYRELHEETGAKAPYLEQLFTFGSKDRDPRDWTLSVSYFALMAYDDIKLKAGTDASEARLWPVNNGKVSAKLAFDHTKIVNLAVERLGSKLEYSAIAGFLLGGEFTLPELQEVYEIILNEKLDKTSFRRGLAKFDIVQETGRKTESQGHRPAKYYRFNKHAKDSLFFPRSIVRSAK
ncbi:hypothetical protein MNBD_GAMMA12-2748 [hydrothermal vent metagenome]|uniref:Nudix hydrolase domain-containing protein n=1 Tax=hydrothermal vent metagenome TaxID=652676 RepID=A0A3B0YBA2_9ZZZZ